MIHRNSGQRSGQAIDETFGEALKTFTRTSNNISSALHSNTSQAQSQDRVDQFCDYLKCRLKDLDNRDRFKAIKEIKMTMLSLEEQEKYIGTDSNGK